MQFGHSYACQNVLLLCSNHSYTVITLVIYRMLCLSYPELVRADRFVNYVHVYMQLFSCEMISRTHDNLLKDTTVTSFLLTLTGNLEMKTSKEG